MKAFVITIFDNPKSVESAGICIRSARRMGVEVKKHKAFTPNDSPMKIASEKGIPIEGFDEVYSRFENCLAAFLSHHSLWEKCIEINEPVIILEHDAVFVNQIPPFFVHKIVNIGKPSYGRYNRPPLLGENPLVSKKYLPGAHGYYVEPAGAKELIKKAEKYAAPTDVFINLDHFPDIHEYNPWPVEARDSYTTIQNENGCQAKHNYSDKYEIL